MAVTQSSPSKPIIPPNDEIEEKMKEKKKKKTKESDCEQVKPSDSLNACPPHAKRTKCPGVRVIGRRIYDSENGKTCHQCRQKTMDFVAACKFERENNKPCTIKFCHKCLLNRYGEKAEEVELLSDWQCPRCRGICNCSFCMKKRGQQPTGILVHAAKATGFSSVSEMLHIKGPENVGTSPKKRNASSKKSLTLEGDGKKIQQIKRKKLGQENSNTNNVCEGSNDDFEGSLVDTIQEEEMMDKTDDGVQMKKSKKIRLPKKATLETVKGEGEEITERDNGGTDSVTCISEEINQDHIKEEDKMDTDDAEAKPETITNLHNLNKNAMKTNDAEFVAEVPLPQGVDLATVAGIDLPPEDIGHALQFLEFCEAFGEVLDLKKGQPESILQELSNQCNRRRGQYSVVIQFSIQLLSLIQKDMGEGSTLSSTNNGSSWLQALGKCISESNCALIDLPSDCFVKDGVGYDSLDPSKKLRLLNFLCDESLCTADLRNWIDAQNLRISERAKEAKGKILAAKDKERLLKQKMGEVAKAYMSKNGAPNSISEHENLVSQIKAESSKAHAETLEALDMVPKKKQRSDAVRTDPVFLDGKGHAFWRLRGYSSEPNILLQDIRSWDTITSEEKWFTYVKEKEKEVEDYISSVRRKSFRIQVVSDRHALERVTSDTSIKNET